jgi:hypothetical protein
MSTIPPSSPQFEFRHSSSSIADFAEPRFIALEHFLKTYRAAISEVEIVRINGQQFVDLETAKTKMLILRARYS